MVETYVHFWWQLLLVAIGAALLGSINFSVLFSRLFKKDDVRNYGSGNPGTTNMFRVFGLPLGLLTFVADSLKGVCACLVSKAIFIGAGLPAEAARAAEFVAGLFAVVGHVFPVYYNFRGGKGVATSIGVMFCVDPILMLCSLPVMIAVILITDRMSVMSMLFAVFDIVWAWCVFLPREGVLSCVCLTLMFAIVLFAHRHNFVRLVKGHELPTGVRRALRGKAKTEYGNSQCNCSADVRRDVQNDTQIDEKN